MADNFGLKLVSTAFVAWLFLTYSFDALGDEARDLYKRGVEHFDAERYIEAAASFREAHAIKPTWKLLYNIGQSEAAGGRYGLALEAFEAYLVQGADQVPEDRSEEVLKELKRLPVLIGVIQVEAPDKVELTVDNVSRGVTPFEGPVRVAVGKHSIVLKQDGVVVLERSISIAGGMTTELKLEEEARPPAATPAAAATPPAKEPVPEPAPQKPEKEPEVETEEVLPASQEEEKKGLSPVPFYFAAGVTGALAAGTVVLEALVLQKKSEIEKDSSDKDAKDSGKSMQLGERIMLGLTGAALATSVVLLIFTDFSKDKEKSGSQDTASVVPLIVPSGAGVGLTGRF